MSTHIDALRLRAVMGKDYWMAPRPYGPDGWHMRSIDLIERASVVVTAADHDDGAWWVHASIARESMPTYEDLKRLHRAAYGDGWAMQVFVPSDEHVDIHEFALHLWGRLDGKRPACLPDFGYLGSI